MARQTEAQTARQTEWIVKDEHGPRRETHREHLDREQDVSEISVNKDETDRETVRQTERPRSPKASDSSD